jgi:hypothetical protein
MEHEEATGLKVNVVIKTKVSTMNTNNTQGITRKGREMEDVKLVKHQDEQMKTSGED